MNRKNSIYDAESHRGSISIDLMPATPRKGRRGQRRGSYKPLTPDGVQPGDSLPEVCPIPDSVLSIYLIVWKLELNIYKHTAL